MCYKLGGKFIVSQKCGLRKIKHSLILNIMYYNEHLEYFGYVSFDFNVNDKSIAVLPFENLSTDADAEIFRDGITEDILTQLSKISELHVISRTTTKRYLNSEKSVPEIAKELGVSYILVGSVRKYGDQVRISTQLIEAKSDKNIWSNKYDITLNDIFGIQTEVSTKIADALQLNLSFEEQQNLANVPVYNIEAYKLFLQGRQEADKRNRESLLKSIKKHVEKQDFPSFEKVIIDDEQFLKAHTYLRPFDF